MLIQLDPRTRPATARRVLTSYFFMNGVVFASWYARIPDIKQRLSMSDGVLGMALFVAAGATVAGLLWVGRLVDRWGSDRVTRPAAVAVPLGLVGPGLAPNVPALVCALLVLGLGGGVINVGMNAQAIRIEKEYSRSIMTSFHASYSFGGLTGAGLSMLCARNGIGPALAFCVLGLLLAVAALVLGPGLLPDRWPLAPGQRPVRSWWTGVDLRTLLVGGCAFACLLAEGVTADWSGVYLRSSLHAPAAVAASGFLVFSISMTVGRLRGDALARRIPVTRLVRICALVAAAGYGLALVTEAWQFALLGIGVFGTGLSCIMPQLYRDAGTNADRVGQAMSVVATISYIGLLSGPALIGITAQIAGLRAALAIVAVLMVSVVALYRPAATTRDVMRKGTF
jgi:predicted MFS family arabinose efflux permease